MSDRPKATQVRKLADRDALVAHLADLGVELPVAAAVTPAPDGPLAQPLEVDLDPSGAGTPRRIGNRFAILPMEGWDATPDGAPTELVHRRWRRFGHSGAKLIWGGEAVAVRADGRANPNQLRLGPDTAGPIAALRAELVAAHVERHDTSDDLVVGLQLTHSGRFARPGPTGDPAPRTAYRHPVLDRRAGDHDAAVLSDGELDDLVADMVAAAVLAQEAGYDFVDVKACHGYLGHELLSAVDRPGAYGGDLAGRSRFLRLAIEGIRRDAPGLGLGVRLSVFDALPHRPDDEGLGRPEPWDGPYRWAFGGDGTGFGVDLTETHRLVGWLADWGVGLLCTTAGSPYYNPHIQRPAYFPPSDGYTPPEDPLVGVARQVAATAALTRAHPDLVVVGSGYSYLQEWLGPVAEAVVAGGGAHLVGLGRMALSYPELPADLLAGRPPETRRLCRTFSDCTTGPRNGVISGCYPLDDHYKAMEARTVVAAAKKAMPGGPARAGLPATDGVAVQIGGSP